MEIKRSIFNNLVEELVEPQCLILVGPRQVGKTTLMLALEEVAKRRGEKTRFLDLEQPADLALLQGRSSDIIETISTGVDILFLDEFYYLEDAGKIFKAIYDRAKRTKKPLKLVASGSSSIEIHRHLKESLAGRSISYRVFPLSFEEYSQWDSGRRPSLRDYLRFGGLPGLSTETSEERKQMLLQEYLSTYIFKDIKGLIKEENVRAFNHLLYLLAQSQGQTVEVSNLARELGMSATTITNYLQILDLTYVNFSIHNYHSNLANELKKSRKTYFYDLGIRNMILKDFRAAESRSDAGQIYETYVFLTLLSLLTPNMEIRFWRTKKKEGVDFILVRNREPIPIEVKTTIERNYLHSGLLAFCRKYPEVKDTYTISQEEFPSLLRNGVTHHYLSFGQVGGIVR